MGTLTRYLLFRILPRRLFAILTVWDVYQLVRRRHGPAAGRQAARARLEGGSRRRMIRGKPLW